MKKLVCVLLALALVVVMTACGGSSDSDSNVLRVGMECAYAPYNWSQSDDSNGAVPIHGSSEYAYGYDVMMAKYIADYLGMELEIYQIEWDSLPVALQAGTIDCVIAGQSITAARLQTVDFSDPYYYASIVSLTTAGSPYADATGLSDLAGATCTSQLNTIWYDVCLPQIENADIQTAMESAPAMLVALESGKVNLVVTDAPTALAATFAYGDMIMLDFTGSDDNFVVSDEEINIGISVQKGNDELLGKINEALATLTVEDYEQMMNDAIAAQPLSSGN